MSDFFFQQAVSDCRNVVPANRRAVYTEYTPVACITTTTVFSQAQITYVLVAQELNSSGLQRHHCAHEHSSVIWSAMSSPCWSLPHFLSSSPPQHEAPPGQHDLLQDDTVHRAPLPEPVQLTGSAREPLSHVNYESGGNPRTYTHTVTVHAFCICICICFLFVFYLFLYLFFKMYLYLYLYL